MDKNGRTNLFLGWAAVLMLAASVLFTACPNANATKTPESPTPKPKYTPVAYDKLAEYLANTASATDVNYIEVTGLQAKHLKGDDSDEHDPKPSPLGAILQAHPTKKVALKLGGSVSALMDMPLCFYKCTSLVGVASIPKGIKDMTDCFDSCTSLTQAPVLPESVTKMNGCFRDCTSLTKAPAIPKGVKDMEMSSCFSSCKSLTQAPTIPEGVKDMKGCFRDCTSLTEVPAIPTSVTEMSSCFFNCKALTSVTLKCNYVADKFGSTFTNCTALGEKSIKVPQAYYGNYTTAEALSRMAVPGDNEAEKKAKFEELTQLNP